MGIRQEEEDPLLGSGTEQNERQQHEQECREEENAGSVVRRTWFESKKIWVIAGPSILSRLAMYSLTVVTQSFSGHLSDLDLAAISICTTVIIAITFGFMVRYHFPPILLLFLFFSFLFICWSAFSFFGRWVV
jgi:MATE family multidrug resistance protein